MLEMLPSRRRRLKRAGEATPRTPFEVLKEQLDREMAEAAERMRVTGEAPTAETAPLLMRLWTAARNKLGKDTRQPNCINTMFFHGARLQILSLFGNHGLLQKFYLREYITGDLLLVGDPRGPVVAALFDSNPKEPT